jgi:hypothetical protein
MLPLLLAGSLVLNSAADTASVATQEAITRTCVTQFRVGMSQVHVATLRSLI